jgi:hypothetical protein
MMTLAEKPPHSSLREYPQREPAKVGVDIGSHRPEKSTLLEGESLLVDAERTRTEDDGLK